MIPKLLFRFILSVFLGTSYLLSAQTSAQASLQRDLTSEGAVISDAYYRHIRSNPWLPKNTSMSDPIKQVNTSPTPAAIIGKFNFKTLSDSLRPGDFVKVPIPNDAELITHTYKIIDGDYGLIGHIIADKNNSYYTFVFNKKIDNLINVTGTFEIGMYLKTPNDNNTFTLPQGNLHSYTYNNGTTSYDIQKLDTKNEDSNNNGCGRYYTLSNVSTTSLDNFLQWEANFNNPLKNNLINDYGNSKVVLKILGNVGLKDVSDIQSYMPHLTDSFKLYEIENGNKNPITLFTNETDFNNYTGTAQAGLLTFEKNNFIANIKLAKPVGNKGYKVEYKSATPADGSYVGNYLQIEVDGSFINLYDTQCSDKSDGFGSLTTAPFPLNSGSSSDWANRVRITKYLNGDISEKGDGVVFTLNKLANGSDTEIDSSFATLTLTTDSEGKANTTKLTPGRYILKETKPKPGGYTPVTNIFEIKKGDTNVIIKNLNNSINTQRLIGLLRKYWLDLENEAEYPAISLMAKVTYANLPDGTPISNPTVRYIPIKVDAGKLKANKNYVEIATPYFPDHDDYGNYFYQDKEKGYLLQNQITFELSEPNPPAGYTAIPNYDNNPNYIGNIKGDYNNKVIVYKYLDYNKNKPGEGAVFTIEKLNTDGNIDTTFTKVVLTTGTDGFTTSEALPVGNYVIKETKPANGGYIIDETYKKGVNFSIVNGEARRFSVNNINGGGVNVPETKVWIDAEHITTKPEVKVNITLTYTPTNLDPDGNPYPQTIRKTSAIIPKGATTTVLYGRETVDFTYFAPYYDDYGNKLNAKVTITEEDIEGFSYNYGWWPQLPLGNGSVAFSDSYTKVYGDLVNTLKNGKPITIKFQDIKGNTLQNDVKLLDRSDLKYFDAYSYDIPENIGSFKYKTVDISNSKGSISEDTPMTIKGYATDTDQVITLIYEKKASASRINPHLRIRAINSK